MIKRLFLRRVLRVAAVIFAAGAVAVVVYVVSIVRSARAYTVATVLPAVRANPGPLSPSDLSPRQLEILLQVEDPRFFQHGGVDLSTPGAGITTITQGLVKRLYFRQFKPGFAKLKQTAIAAFALDPLMPKQEQLRLFLNTVYLGHDANGFEQAALVYFHKPFRQLTEDEYTALVAMVIAPNVFDLQRYPARNAERVARIRRLVRGEYRPKGLFDVYYGPIDPDARKDLPTFSYFASYYR
jgi:membrane peptidoglycan carboxypeptidase